MHDKLTVVFRVSFVVSTRIVEPMHDGAGQR